MKQKRTDVKRGDDLPKVAQIVDVEWTDACSRDRWAQARDHLELLICHTVGAIVERNAEYLTVASTLSFDNHGTANETTIPIGMVRKVWPLGVFRDRKKKKKK